MTDAGIGRQQKNMYLERFSLISILRDMQSFGRQLTPGECAYIGELRHRMMSGGESIWSVLESEGLPPAGRRLTPEVMGALTLMSEVAA